METAAQERQLRIMARPLKIVDEKAILELASKGRTMTEIAAYCGISDDTLRNRFSEVIKRGKALMCGSLRSKQFEMAMTGNATMLVWLGKQELGQVDKSEFNGSIKHEFPSFTDLSDEELASVRHIIESASSRSSIG